MQSITNYAKSYQPNNKAADVLSCSTLICQSVQQQKHSRAVDSILQCLHSAVGIHPQPYSLGTCIFVGREDWLLREPTRHKYIRSLAARCNSTDVTAVVYICSAHMPRYGLVLTAAMQRTSSSGLWWELREKHAESRCFTSWWQSYTSPHLNRPTD